MTLQLTMRYMVETQHHRRPHSTNIPFIAQDFRLWGCRVSNHENDSQYVAMINHMETKQPWRIETLELWAREMIDRKGQAPVPVTSRGEQRLQRASTLLKEFFCGLDICSKCWKYNRTLQLKFFSVNAPQLRQHPPPLVYRPQPDPALSLLRQYVRMIQRIKYNRKTTLPGWVHPDIAIADAIVMDFGRYEELSMIRLLGALKGAMTEHPRTMGRIERNRETGITTVSLYVDVGDCVLPPVMEEGEGLPAYECGEAPPPYAGLDET